MVNVDENGRLGIVLTSSKQTSDMTIARNTPPRDFLCTIVRLSASDSSQEMSWQDQSASTLHLVC